LQRAKEDIEYYNKQESKMKKVAKNKKIEEKKQLTTTIPPHVPPTSPSHNPPFSLLNFKSHNHSPQSEKHTTYHFPFEF